MFVEVVARGPGGGWGGYPSPRVLSSFLFSPHAFPPPLNTAPSVARSTWAWRGTPGNADRKYLMSRRFLNGGVEEELAES